MVNTIGYSVGAILFAVFLYLVWRDSGGVRPRASRLSIAAAALALVWNAASLVAIGLAETSLAGADAVLAVGISALTVLPAVLLDLSLGRRNRWLPRAGYLLSAVAIGIHWSEFALDAPEFHWNALRFTTISFSALALLAALYLVWSREPGREALGPRLFGTVALFLFALTFIHFGVGLGDRAWPVEAIVHHAGIPLALFVLLQDFRFLLLDALVRVVASLAVAAATLAVSIKLAALAGLQLDGTGSPFRMGLLLVAASLALVAFAVFRDRFQRLLTRVLFRRGGLDRVRAELRTHHEKPASGEYIDWAMGRVARFFEAPLLPATDEEADCLLKAGIAFATLASNVSSCRALLEARGAEVVVGLRLAPYGVHYYMLGRRPGGRPYFSEDLEVLSRLAEDVVEHRNHYRDLEIRRLVSQAELHALQSQIHPHFLFNALNTLYGVIPKEASGARRMLLNLADILRYFLKPGKSFIALGEELKIVKSYLEIEQMRLGPKLHTAVTAEKAALAAYIPVLAVQTLVENAVKHGAAKKAGGGEVRVDASIEGDELLVRVADGGEGFQPVQAGRDTGHGVGLDNVRRRLKLCYGEASDLDIKTGPSGTVIGFRVPARERVEAVR